ncbi:thermonuclease family protein [Sphingobium lignivorans]|uniref:Endonuclease YncB(Thermonuclease family) n=1 Tax=Sphingobium lignivorans TaxID=2735886 RepID=A0ABR6NFB9_9SPHN|nr:thermonuclease family protein [Sphingobium lignivorans]MBB5985327.1 endonuclease YncB(thermonuclease family) [Sphingobium lignivorans]
MIAAAAISCVVIDGDTLRCGRERVRLLAIDAPELPGHCRRGRTCVAGDPEASRASLQRLVARGAISIERNGKDRYGRTLAIVRARGLDVGCAQVKRGHAVFVPRWDAGGRAARSCGRAA